jgi:hypothetical protein
MPDRTPLPTTPPILAREVAASLVHVLRDAGVPDPRVHVHKVAAIPRLAQSGKTRRFIPR